MNLEKLSVFLITLIIITSMATIGVTYAQDSDIDTNQSKTENIEKQSLVQKSTLSYFQQIEGSKWSNINIDIPPPENLEQGPNIIQGTASEVVIFNPETGQESTMDLQDDGQSDSFDGNSGLLQRFNAITPTQQRDQVIDRQFESPQQATHGSSDGRVRITPTTPYPWRAVGYLSTGCTASLIEPDVILTAGHCVNDGDDGGWFSNIKFYPGRDGSTKPFGKANWIRAVTYKRWANSGDSKYDLAIVELDRNIGNWVGYFGRMARGSNHPVYNGIINTAGYPGDKPGVTMQFDADQGKGAGTHFHRASVSVWKGQSGSPMWAYYSGRSSCPACRYVTSVVTYHGNPMWANRLNPNKYNHLNNWMNRFFSTPTVANSNPVERDVKKKSIPITSKDKPDLVDDGKRWSSVDKTTVSAGEEIQVQHDIRNIGTANVTPINSETQLNMQYYLSKDREMDKSDIQIGQRSKSIGHGNLMPFRYIDVQSNLQIPENIEKGDYNLCFELDSTDNIEEFNETNNVAYPTVRKITISRQFDISTNSPVSPGGNATVSITVSSVGGISIDNIPEGWDVVDSQNDNGIIARNDPDNDNHNESAGWVWQNAGDKSTSLTLSVPGNENEGNYTLNSTIRNGNEVTKQFTIEVRETDFDEDNDGQIDSNEVKNAIRQFLFENRLNSNQIKNIIRRFLFG